MRETCSCLFVYLIVLYFLSILRKEEGNHSSQSSLWYSTRTTSCLVYCTLRPERGRKRCWREGECYGILSKLCLTLTIIIMFLIQFVVLLHRYTRTARLAANNRASFPSSAPWQCCVILAQSHSIKINYFSESPAKSLKSSSSPIKSH